MRRLATLLILTAALAAHVKPADIRLGTVMPSGTSYVYALQQMGQSWRQMSGGAVRLIIYDGGKLGDEADIVRRIREGQLQAGMLSVTGLSDIDKSVTALSYMPMMFRSMEELDYIREQLRPELDSRLRNTGEGFVALAWAQAGWVRFFSKEPVIHPDDLKRLKMFAWAGDNYQIDLVRSLGFQPVPLASTDIVSSLQTGLVSAVPTAPFYANSIHMVGYAPHMLEMNWAPLVGAIVVTAKAWDSIPAGIRGKLQSAADEAGARLRTSAREEGEESVRTMAKRGLKIHPAGADVEAEWRRLAEQVYPKIRGNMVPADMFDRVQKLLADYRASKGIAAQ